MTTWLFRIFLILITVAFSPVWAFTSLGGLDSVKAILVTKTNGAKPGSTLHVGVLLKHQPGWHTYWKTPGDTGYPTSIQWVLPEGWTSGEISWPTPKVFRIGEYINYGYDGEILLPVPITVPAEAKVGSTQTIQAKVSWLMCHTQCIPGSATLTADIVLENVPQNSHFFQVFQNTEAKIPKNIDDVSGKIDETKQLIELTFKFNNQDLNDFYIFAEENQSIKLSSPQKLQIHNQNQITLFLQSDHLKAEDSFSGVLSAKKITSNDIWSRTFSTKLVPDRISISENNLTTRNTTLSPLLFSICMAFVGGMILNLMPCVFPVLSLKIMGLINNRNNNKILLLHGVVYTLGVLLTMLVFALILVFVKNTGTSMGWGFQLQSPEFIGLLTFLFIAISLNLFGIYEFTLGSSVQFGSNNLNLARLSTSFCSGILTVIVASPCTAPFMGTALGYALTTSNFETFLIFISLGFGISAPWLLLTTFPVLTQWLPKPGCWMVTFRKILAIPMLLTVFWLLWIIHKQTTLNAFLGYLTISVLFAITLWLYGLVQYGRPQYRKSALLCGLITIMSYSVLTYCNYNKNASFSQEVNASSIANQWSVEAVDTLLRKQQPVFVNFTASWCITCQVNKVAVLDRKTVQDAFSEKNVAILIADWTSHNSEISLALKKYNRGGVPLYLLYDPNGEVIVLPELLTDTIVLDALNKLSPQK
ncbi:MAG: thioredoxin family protein [Burkholderiaceae bacterium]|nr:thioredoxin family protein [Burkholderiaceae bacterium]